MADTPVVPATPPIPTGGGGLAVTPEAGFVRLSQADYDAMRSQAEKAKTLEPQVAEFQGLWENTQRLIRSDVDPAQKEAAVRAVMTKAGYSADQVEQYVQQALGGEETPAAEKPGPTEQRVAALEGELNRTRVTQLKDSLDRGVNGALDQHTGVATFLKRVGELNGPEGAARAKTTLTEQIQKRTLENLSARRQQSGRFEDSWIKEEALKAAEAVTSQYRSVIGDLDRLGRTPETDSGEDAFLKTPPVPPPVYKPGMRTAQASGMARDYIKDQLTRLAAETSRGRSVV